VAEDRAVRFDRFVLVACALFALLMTGLTLGAADLNASGVPAAAILIFLGLGLAPYGLTVVLSAIRPFRRWILTTTRAVAVIYGVFDCGLRYLALYHPTGSTDSVVVVALPFWWVPILLVVAAVTAVVHWLRPEPIRPDSTPSQA
jgi:hypothetical protein